jgi:hypothetical protein
MAAGSSVVCRDHCPSPNPVEVSKLGTGLPDQCRNRYRRRCCNRIWCRFEGRREDGSVGVAGAPAMDYGLIPAYGAGVITPNGNHPPVVLWFAKGQSPF